MLLTSTSLIVPAGKAGAPSISIDLQAILRSEVRQEEVAFVTKAKAGELLSEFNRSWRDLHALVTQLSSEKLQAEKAVGARKSVLLLEVVPARLKELGVQSSADTREAVVLLDEEYQTLQDVADQLTAAVELLKGKLKSFENAFTSTKRLISEDAMNYGKNPNLSGDTYSKPEPSPTTSGPARRGFGTPRYGS